MNTAEREAIKEMYGDFLKDLHVDPEFLGPMIEDGVLTESMVDKIQAMPTQSEKIMQLLQVLPRCGQTAFSCFLEVLRKRSVWLAEKLQRKYKEKRDKQPQTTKEFREHTIEQANNDLKEDMDNDSGENQDKFDRGREAHFYEPISPRANLFKTNSNISKCSSYSPPSASAIRINYEHKLNHLYTNLKNKIRKHQKREMSFAEPVPATFEMIEKLHDQLFEQVKELQMIVNQCYRAMGITDDKVPLVSYISKLKAKVSDLEKQLKSSEEQRNKYCDKIIKLDLRVRDQASVIQVKEEKLTRLSNQEMALKRKIQQLEEKLKASERKAAETDEATRVWQKNYIQLQKGHEHICQPIHYNSTSAKENMQGNLQISNQTKETQTDGSKDHESASPRQLQTVEKKKKRQTDGQQIEKDKLKQDRTIRRQSRHKDYYRLSCLGGINENEPTQELKNIGKNEKEIIEIKQMKDSLQNATLSEKDNSDQSSKLHKQQVYIPTVSMQKTEEAEDAHINQNTQTPYRQFQVYNPTVNMQKTEEAEDPHINQNTQTQDGWIKIFNHKAVTEINDEKFKLQIPVVNMQRDEKVLAEKESHQRKSCKKKPLLRAISLQESKKEIRTKPMRKMHPTN